MKALDRQGNQYDNASDIPSGVKITYLKMSIRRLTRVLKIIINRKKKHNRKEKERAAYGGMHYGNQKSVAREEGFMCAIKQWNPESTINVDTWLREDVIDVLKDIEKREDPERVPASQA